MNYKQIAKQIIDVYNSDEKIKELVDNSPEPYRALVWETGIVQDPASIDNGSKIYDNIVNALQKIW